MAYAIAGSPTTDALAHLRDELARGLERSGVERARESDSAALVLNLVDVAQPKPYRRHSKGTFVAALHERDEPPADVLAATYPLLVRALANVVLLYVPPNRVWFTTMERGAYVVEGSTPQELARRVLERLEPLAGAHLVIDNEFRPDLKRSSGRVTRSRGVRAAGVRLGELDLLPAPFPIEQWLDERDLRHVKRLYGIGGLSYGNLSARKDERRFWMSASGVDKTQPRRPGPRHPARVRLRRRPRRDRPQRAADGRAATRVGRRDRALDDLRRPPRRRRDPPRARLDGGHRGDRRELPVRDGGAGARASPTSSGASPTPTTPSSACGTTASPRRATAWRRSSTASRRGSSARCRCRSAGGADS